MKDITNAEVLRAFLAFPSDIRPKLMALRRLIFETAASIDDVGPLEETLKWGEPAYLTSQSKRGSTIRLGWKKSKPSQYAMYFICNTNLVERFRMMYPDQLQFEGNRAVVFDKSDPVPADIVRECIAAALTYHRNSTTSHCMKTRAVSGLRRAD